MTPFFNIIVGLVLIVGGLTGNLAFFGTNNSNLLAAVGGIPLIMGIHQLWKRKA
jgi:hypothetical protein